MWWLMKNPIALVHFFFPLIFPISIYVLIFLPFCEISSFEALRLCVISEVQPSACIESNPVRISEQPLTKLLFKFFLSYVKCKSRLLGTEKFSRKVIIFRKLDDLLLFSPACDYACPCHSTIFPF